MTDDTSHDLPEFPPEQVEAFRKVAKEELRRRLAAVRRALPAATRDAFACAMAEQLIKSEIFQRAKVVAAYSALRFEMDPRAIVAAARAQGKIIGLPRVTTQDGGVELHRYEPGDELLESHFMVKEPLESAPRIELTQVDLVLVPGLAFDLRGHRLGFGQGYYDRFLPRLPNAVRIGLAFELQLLAEVPAASHDVPVDWLATERRMLRCER